MEEMLQKTAEDLEIPADDAFQSPARTPKERRRSSCRFFFAGFFLTVLIAGIAFAVMKVWPFGDKSLLIVDSVHQYWPFYTDMHNKLVNGESLFYSFSGGLGYNFWSTFAYYLASPFNFLMVLIPTEHVCDFMDLMILVKLGVSGGCFSWYLHRRDESCEFLPAVFGVMFALSNFMIGYYFNLMWLDSIMVLPLILFGIEQIVNGKSGKLFGFSLFYALWCNYYIGFMLCIFSCLYFLVRWISAERYSLRQIAKSCVRFAWFALLAGGMAAMVLIPAYMGLSASESMEGNKFPTTIKFYTTFLEMMRSHMPYLEPVNISSSQVGLNAYCGLLTLLLAVLYLFDRKVRLRERLAHYGLCALLLLSFAFNVLNYIWHGFHVQNGLPNRFAFLYIAVLLIIAYDAARHIRSYWLPELLFAFALPMALCAYSWMLPSEDEHLKLEIWAVCVSAGLLLVYFGVLLIGRYAKRVKKFICFGLLSAVALAECATNAVYGISENGGVTRSLYIADQTSYQALMEEQGDDTFYRSEVDRQRMRNVTMFAGGNSMVMFNSTMQGAVIDFFDSIGVEARMNKNGYLGVTKLMNDVLGIKYLASPSKEANTMYQFEYLSENGELALYRNDNALSLGFLVSDEIRSWEIRDEEPLTVQNSFVQLATGLDPIFVLDREIDMRDGENYGIYIPENKQVYLCLDTRVSKIELNTPEYTKSFSDYTDHLYAINRTEEEDQADFTVTLKETQKSGTGTVKAEVYTCANDAYQKVIDALAGNQLEQVEAGGSRISGTIVADKAGTLLLTVPYDEGWTVLVDGEETETYPVGEALLGVHLEEGTHEIRMKYVPEGFWLGAGISLVCAALFALTWLLGWYRRRRAENMEL